MKAGESKTRRGSGDGAKWVLVENDKQSDDQVVFCAVSKADEPAERLLGSKRPCRIDSELSAGGDVETAGREPERRPSRPSPSSLSSSLLLSLVHSSASSGQ